ncbi:MAG: NusG domain II-containing protein [Lachnospiraceae bacterium]|nr:NusG domain II-containing protein [Lachnospiraceae bacterium]
MRKYLSRNDIILILILLVCATASLVVPALGKDRAGHVSVWVDGNPYGEYDLSIDRQVEIDGYKGGINILIIKDGEAYISEASCPDKLCIHQGRINKEGQELVCLPNRVLVRASGKDGSEYDAITGR